MSITMNRAILRRRRLRMLRREIGYQIVDAAKTTWKAVCIARWQIAKWVAIAAASAVAFVYYPHLVVWAVGPAVGQ